MRWRGWSVLGVAGATVLAACGSSPSSFGTPSVAAGCRLGQGIAAQASTKTYIVQLDIGPIEDAFTPEEVDSRHPIQGDVVLRGQISAVSGTLTGSGFHLAAHICSKAGGAVIQDANPRITLVNDTAKSEPQVVPVAVMQAVAAGINDLHYGNNVVLAPGAAYTVVVSLNGEAATLHVEVPSLSAFPTTTETPVTDMHGM